MNKKNYNFFNSVTVHSKGVHIIRTTSAFSTHHSVIRDHFIIIITTLMLMSTIL